MLARIKERMGKEGSNKSVSETFGVNEVTFPKHLKADTVQNSLEDLGLYLI
jgi:hypothetical protein